MTEIRKCRVCGCTDNDCSQCIEKTGQPCHWVEEDLCSACGADEIVKALSVFEESSKCFYDGGSVTMSGQDDDDYDDSECWLCHCGNYIEDGFHCPKCGAEPPWGCPCSDCETPEEDDDEFNYLFTYDDE